jgi:hypothetical protein
MPEPIDPTLKQAPDPVSGQVLVSPQGPEGAPISVEVSPNQPKEISSNPLPVLDPDVVQAGVKVTPVLVHDKSQIPPKITVSDPNADMNIRLNQARIDSEGSIESGKTWRAVLEVFSINKLLAKLKRNSLKPVEN